MGERYPVSHGRERYQSRATCIKIIPVPLALFLSFVPEQLAVYSNQRHKPSCAEILTCFIFKQHVARMSAAHEQHLTAYRNGKLRERRGKARSSVACLSCRVRKVRCDVVIGAPCSNCKLDMIGEHCQLPLHDRCSCSFCHLQNVQ